MAVFIVGSVNSENNWSISAKPKVHTSYREALEEASRLTLLNQPDKISFIVFEIKAETNLEMSCRVSEYK